MLLGQGVLWDVDEVRPSALAVPGESSDSTDVAVELLATGFLLNRA